MAHKYPLDKPLQRFVAPPAAIAVVGATALAAGVDLPVAAQAWAMVIGLAAITVPHLLGISRTAPPTLKWSVICALVAAGIVANRDRGWTLISDATLLVRGILVWDSRPRVRPRY